MEPDVRFLFLSYIAYGIRLLLQLLYLGRDTADEALDVQLGRTRLLTRGVGTFQTPCSFTYGGTLAQRRVFDVVKVL